MPALERFLTGLRDLWTLFALVTSYYLTTARHVRRQLARSRRRAGTIPDPHLRAFALGKLEQERLNAEAAAVLATLVPRRRRASAARLMTAFQVMYDYLDAVSEQDVADPVRNGLRLHEALAAALTAPAGDRGYYAHGPYGDDGGYLAALSAACREELWSLPSAAVVLPELQRAVVRCSEGQTRTHAAALGDVDQLVSWARAQAPDSGYAWWELAAGAASSLAVHALFAVAGAARTTAADARAVDAAYFPPICTLSTLLDALVDREHDAAAGVHNYVGYYPSDSAGGERFGRIARDADAAARGLPQGGRHAAIAAGLCAFYLSAMPVWARRERGPSRRIVSALRPVTVYPLLAVLRWKRGFETG